MRARTELLLVSLPDSVRCTLVHVAHGDDLKSNCERGVFVTTEQRSRTRSVARAIATKRTADMVCVLSKNCILLVAVRAPILRCLCVCVGVV